MPIRKFYIQSAGKVIDVGLRSSLIPLGSEYNLKIFARNLYKERKVEAILSGADEDIKAFWQYVKQHDIRPVKNGKPYTVSEIEPYDEAEPDWGYYASAFVAEQISKGVRGIDTINEKLGGLDAINEKLGVMGEKLGGIDAINEKLGGVDDKLGRVAEEFSQVAERFGIFGEYIKELHKTLIQLPKRIASAMEKTKRK
jgi:acylphosphatase